MYVTLLWVMMVAFWIGVFTPLNALMVFQILARGVNLLKVLHSSWNDAFFASLMILRHLALALLYISMFSSVLLRWYLF